MTYYFVSGNTVNVEPSDSLDVVNSLPAKTYVIKMNPIAKTYFLQTTADFELPKKIYGHPNERSSRIIETFMSRPKSTGVLLTGDKGSGKSLLMKLTAIELMKLGIPTIIVNEALSGQEFNTFIASITQPVVILFDEFDKIYKNDDQEALLTLLDGTIETKKLFMFTVNSGHVDQHMLNRPGRIYYKYDYRGLDEDFIRDYCEDNLKNKDHMESVMTVTTTFSMFTFDMLQALIEEMNRYNENPFDVMKHINVDFASEHVTYDISMMYDGQIVSNSTYPNKIRNSPLVVETDMTIYTGKNVTFDDSYEEELNDIALNTSTLYKVTKNGQMVFRFNVREKDLFITIEREKPRSMNWSIVA